MLDDGSQLGVWDVEGIDGDWCRVHAVLKEWLSVVAAPGCSVDTLVAAGSPGDVLLASFGQSSGVSVDAINAERCLTLAALWEHCVGHPGVLACAMDHAWTIAEPGLRAATLLLVWERCCVPHLMPMAFALPECTRDSADADGTDGTIAAGLAPSPLCPARRFTCWEPSACTTSGQELEWPLLCAADTSASLPLPEVHWEAHPALPPVAADPPVLLSWSWSCVVPTTSPAAAASAIQAFAASAPLWTRGYLHAAMLCLEALLHLVGSTKGSEVPALPQPHPALCPALAAITSRRDWGSQLNEAKLEWHACMVRMMAAVSSCPMSVIDLPSLHSLFPDGASPFFVPGSLLAAQSAVPAGSVTRSPGRSTPGRPGSFRSEAACGGSRAGGGLPLPPAAGGVGTPVAALYIDSGETGDSEVARANLLVRRKKFLVCLLEARCPFVAQMCSLMGISVSSVRRDLALAFYRAGEDDEAFQAVNMLPPDVKVSIAQPLFDIARRRLAQSLHRIHSHPRYCHVLAQVDPRMASWVCEVEGSEGSDSQKNPFAGMDSATSAPLDDGVVLDEDGSVNSASAHKRVSIHPATLAMTSTLLALVVSLLRGDGEGGDRVGPAGTSLVVRTKYMLDMCRVLLTELPADAAFDRL